MTSLELLQAGRGLEPATETLTDALDALARFYVADTMPPNGDPRHAAFARGLAALATDDQARASFLARVRTLRAPKPARHRSRQRKQRL